jgi:tyrosyl-tRNA synthetase
MKVVTDKARIEEMFARGTVMEVLPSKEELIKKMVSGERIKIYIGLDPTATSIHLGHAKNVMFLEEMRKLGHEVILLFGDFTARIGDPSDKKATRKQLTAEEVKKNVAGWVEQFRPLLDFDDKENPARLEYNSSWLSKLNFNDVLELAANFTVQQMLERDMFRERLNNNTPIHVHEFMYPLMQGYDSVAMNVDAELCGTDQIFNAMAGRVLQKRFNNKDKFVIALNLIANPKTGELMSKSNGTGVFVDVPGNELFGAIMALPDPMIDPLFLNCTRIPMADREKLMTHVAPRRVLLLILSRDFMAKRSLWRPSRLSTKLLPKVVCLTIYRRSNLLVMVHSLRRLSKRASCLQRPSGDGWSMMALLGSWTAPK